MSKARFTEEFKVAAVKQVAEHGRPVAEVAARLGVSTHSLYGWLKRYNKPTEQRKQESAEAAELKRLRTEVKRLTEERDILKKPPRTLPRSPAEVRVYRTAFDSICGASTLRRTTGAPQRLLRMATQYS
ncbi:hypothetical protein GCM10023337_00890 [Paenalcaligenes hermetiae]|uniref:Transposase n=1 Tax=Paenalcaligenes hermetiae TaxID=1157987 RepID=A0ABP9LWR9_9BURK